jgi:hypothetical protein
VPQCLGLGSGALGEADAARLLQPHHQLYTLEAAKAEIACQ